MHPFVPTTTSLIVSATDNSDALNLVLASIAGQTHRPLEIFVADESSYNQSASVVDYWAGKLSCPIVRIAAERPGECRAPLLNRILRVCAGDYLIFIEGDCLLHRRFVADHLRQAKTGTFLQGRRGGVRARYVRRILPGRFHPLFWFLQRRVYGVRHLFRRPWASVRLNDLRTIHGCNFSVSRADLIRVNGFNECFDETGVEMVELAVRLRTAGLTLRTITGQAIVYHLDHRHVARYRSLNTVRILNEAQRDPFSRCERGLVILPAGDRSEASTPELPDVTSPIPAKTGERAQTLPPQNGAIDPSHFRDKIVPGSMLSSAAQRSS